MTAPHLNAYDQNLKYLLPDQQQLLLPPSRQALANGEPNEF